MPLSLSHGPFTRKLSVQAEESGADVDNGDDSDQPLVRAVMPLSFHQSTNLIIHPPCCGQPSETEGNSYLRKLSIASMSSIKSTNSLSSTCSAPGEMSSVGGENCNSDLYKKEESFDLKQPTMSRRIMTSRPSFISLCSIVSETSEVPQKFLPAPLQVELDLMQRSGIEGDEPKFRSHLPILRCPSDYDINEMDNWKSNGSRRFNRNSKKGLVSGIKQFPSRMRKLSTEKNRFDIYSLSDDVRDQLKRLYVY